MRTSWFYYRMYFDSLLYCISPGLLFTYIQPVFLTYSCFFPIFALSTMYTYQELMNYSHPYVCLIISEFRTSRLLSLSWQTLHYPTTPVCFIYVIWYQHLHFNTFVPGSMYFRCPQYASACNFVLFLQLFVSSTPWIYSAWGNSSSYVLLPLTIFPFVSRSYATYSALSIKHIH